MTITTFSLDGLLVGGGFVGLFWAIAYWVKQHIEKKEIVDDARREIKCGAMWDYNDRNRGMPKVEKGEPNFYQQLDEETQKNYFKERNKEVKKETKEVK